MYDDENDENDDDDDDDDDVPIKMRNVRTSGSPILLFCHSSMYIR